MQSGSQETTTQLVLVHGAWSSAGSWASVMPILEKAGLSTVAVNLPSVQGMPGAPAAGMHADARTIRSAVDAIDGPVAVVAHSYGGVPATEAIVGAKNVTTIIYVAAFLLDAGQCLLDAVGGTEPESWLVSADGLLVELVDPLKVLYADCPDDVARSAVTTLRPHYRRAFVEKLQAAGWKEAPATYIVCDNDKALPPAIQNQMAAQVERADHLTSGHTPFLSHPAQLADAIVHAL